MVELITIVVGGIVGIVAVVAFFTVVGCVAIKTMNAIVNLFFPGNK